MSDGSLSEGSDSSMLQSYPFRNWMFFAVPTVICSDGCTFQKFYIPTVLSSEGSIARYLGYYRSARSDNDCVSGLGVTLAVLSVGLWTLKTGNTSLSQKMMRWRVGAQSFTVLSLIAGIMYSGGSRPT